MGSSVLIVIVNYRTSDLAVECLRSIEAEAGDPSVARVAVVDNRSEDGSVERLRAAIARNGWSRWAELIASERNGGFAAGNNLAIRAELSRPPAERAGFVLLLNPDTVIRPGALRELVAFMKEHPEVGIAGSRIEDVEGRPQGSARRFPSPLSELESAARLGPLTRLLRRHVVPMKESDRIWNKSLLVTKQVPERATGKSGDLLNISTQSGSPGAALASHSFRTRFVVPPTEAATLLLPGVGMVNCHAASGPMRPTV